MTVTPRMWGIEQRIKVLETIHGRDPNDYMVEFELNELRIKLDKLRRIEKLGLRLVQGGLQASDSLTEKTRQGA